MIKIMEDNNDNIPIRKKCRIEAIPDVTLLAKCQEAYFKSCAHAFVYQNEVICLHPDWQQIMIVDQGINRPEHENRWRQS